MVFEDFKKMQEVEVGIYKGEGRFCFPLDRRLGEYSGKYVDVRFDFFNERNILEAQINDEMVVEKPWHTLKGTVRKVVDDLLRSNANVKSHSQTKWGP